MFPVAVTAGAGWLFLFVVLLIVPPLPGPHEGGGQGEGKTGAGWPTRAGSTSRGSGSPSAPGPAGAAARPARRCWTTGVRPSPPRPVVTEGWSPPTARPAPGVADGYLVSQGAGVTVSTLTALISIHGSVHIASEASLAGLLPVVEGRLRELARRIDFNQY